MNGQSPPRTGRKVQWLMLGGAVLAFALALWVVRSAVGVGDAGKNGSAGGSDSLPGAPAANASRDVAAGRQASVAATVAQNNRESAREAEAFLKAGWTMVATEPPDQRLLALDPALLVGRERDLRVQIASTVPAPAMAPRLGQIALQAAEPATRVAAVEALGRMGTPEAQKELLALLPGLPADDEARQAIVPLLRPTGLDDGLAGQLVAQLDGTTLTPVEKKQVAFTLALVGLRDGMAVRAGAASPKAHQLIDEMTALAQRGGGQP